MPGERGLLILESAMRYVWDVGKEAANSRRHGFSFDEASQVLESTLPVWTELDETERYDEARWRSIGWYAGTLLVVIHAESDDGTRIISARRAEKNERKRYLGYCQHYL